MSDIPHFLAKRAIFMGLIRFLFFLLVLWVLWFMARNWLRKQELSASRDKARVTTSKVVRCKHCDVHLPEQDALRDGDDWFCTAEHKQAWLSKDSNKS